MVKHPETSNSEKTILDRDERRGKGIAFPQEAS